EAPVPGYRSGKPRSMRRLPWLDSGLPGTAYTCNRDGITDLVTGESSLREITMRWVQRILSAGAVSAALAFTGMSGVAVAAGQPSESFADLAAQVTPAVVSISTHRALGMSADNPAGESSDQEKSKDSRYSASLGSGFILDPSGY